MLFEFVKCNWGKLYLPIGSVCIQIQTFFNQGQIVEHNFSQLNRKGLRQWCRNIVTQNVVEICHIYIRVVK